MAESAAARYVSLIMPSRWFAGGKGLNEFREKMLNDKRIAVLADYQNSADCFPTLGNRGVKGGICYFLWDSLHNDKCLVKSFSGTACTSSALRYLKEDGCEIFIRDAVGVSILNKVKNKKQQSFATIVSTRKPFGFATNFTDFDREKKEERQIKIYAYHTVGYIDRTRVLKNDQNIDKYKLYVPEAIGNADVANDKLKAIVGEAGTCCTETYLLIGPFNNEKEALNCNSYINTRFFHFLLSLKKITQHTTQKCYEFIPLQDFSESWNDEKLYKTYDFSDEEIKYIKNTVWPKN